ncbi:MAG: hypothetical protein CSA66_04790 [Proteobacteria bacterium]|nr:MAG: hypothetical protein CSA66_04790 [Pseudomonadota bacterium]
MSPYARALLAASAAALLGACALGGEGAGCRVDSDCEAGLLCAPAGTCQSEAAVAASLERPGAADAVDVVSFTDTAATGGAGGDVTGCAPLAGVFEASQARCREPRVKLTVTGLVVLDSGAGLAQLATVANPVIAAGYDEGTLAMALWVDGEYAPGCPHALAWMRGQADRAADCTAVFSDSMPFEVPNLVSTAIEQAHLDPETNILRGLVDKAALLASMDEVLRDVADSLIVLDVDTDGDEVPDRASAHLEILFAE